jgi:2-methylcitrate dehydratase
MLMPPTAIAPPAHSHSAHDHTSISDTGGDTSRITLPADSNQALGLAHFALAFMSDATGGGGGGEPDAAVIERTNLFHVDACLCGLSAIALGTNAPTVLRREAAQYAVPAAGIGSLAAPGLGGRNGVPVFGSRTDAAVEKAVAANVAAVREWDSNGTNFGYSEHRAEHRAGEFGHNDFYPVAVAAAQMAGLDGRAAMKGMILLDEIRGRLAEVFSLKTYKIDHVVHGAIASAAVYGAMMGATPEQIESAIGMVVAHAIPFRAIRAGHQLSDSKGASAAISTEFAVLCMKRSMMGFVGPADIFRNPEAIFCLFEGKAAKHKDTELGAEIRKGKRSPFDLVLSRAGRDFTVMGMHFKLGLYEHQSAGALQGLIDLLRQKPELAAGGGERISKIVIRAYEPAFGIIGDPAKRDPHTRQSADHSMLYLVSTMLRKAIELHGAGGPGGAGEGGWPADNNEMWKALMLLPEDFTHDAITHPLTRRLMEKTAFEHGGPDYDRRYPDGIPTSIVVTDSASGEHDSRLVMYPSGHARNLEADLKGILAHKFKMLGRLGVKDPQALINRLSGIERKSAGQIANLWDFDILSRGRFE